MPRRWTIKQLKEISDFDFAIEILHERKMTLTNYYAPLYKKICDVIRNLKTEKNQKEKLIKYLEEEKKNFKEQGYCTSYDMAVDQVAKNAEIGADYMYDVGRYELLCDILERLTKGDTYDNNLYQKTDSNIRI